MPYRFSFSERFHKHFLDLTEQERILILKKLELFAENPMHPSLRTKRVQGTDRMFECSINLDLRVIWHHNGDDLIILADVGRHSILRKY